eukprot:1114261-Rhodomonas_salina.1
MNLCFGIPPRIHPWIESPASSFSSPLLLSFPLSLPLPLSSKLASKLPLSPAREREGLSRRGAGGGLSWGGG